jgi:hypothetical protein
VGKQGIGAPLEDAKFAEGSEKKSVLAVLLGYLDTGERDVFLRKTHTKKGKQCVYKKCRQTTLKRSG